jgi:predicted small secreted protein
MKKFFAALFAALTLAALALAACEKKEEEVGADIDTMAALQSIMEAARSAAGEGVFVPVTLDGEVSNDNSENKLGLTPEQFGQYVTEGCYMTAGIATQAFEVVLVKCIDYASAKEVKSLAAKGYNSGKWICALPEQCFVIDSGRFVMLGAVYDNTSELFLTAFKDQFETTAGEVNKFYEKGDNEPAEGGMGGLILE